MDWNDKIDAYFNGELDQQEQADFVSMLETNEAFAAEVALYLASRHELRETLLNKKREQWKASKPEAAPIRVIPNAVPEKPGWWRYAAAACLLLAAVFMYQKNNPGPARLARAYAEKEFIQLSQAMSGQSDSMQLGITAYNQKDYTLASRIFDDISLSAGGKLEIKNGIPSAPTVSPLVQQQLAIYAEALKNKGLVSIATKNYDQAIEQFTELAKMKEIYANAGCFYQAIALLLRNEGPDKQTAKQLLEKVVNEKLEGSEIAQTWLKKY